MKKIIALVLFVLTTNMFSQTDSTKSKISYYGSIGISIGHTDPNDPTIDNFNKSSYPSLELGFMKNNITLGAIVGSENIFISSSTRGFCELKTTINKPIGQCNAYALFGVGAYMENKFNNFIEYGAGFSYAPNKLGYFVQYSNWARTNYISTGLILNF